MIRCLFLFVTLLSLSQATLAQSPAYILPSDPRYKAAADHLVEIVKESLKDADSAKLGPMLVCAYLPDTKIGIIRVNAKNSYGAYQGFSTAVALESAEVRQAHFVNANPYGPDEFSEQRALLKLLRSCDPAIKAYDAVRTGPAK